ncbi:hypothetical protein ACFYOF_16650 [Streptomyces sp. NPDC007148]|uniref:hypothetical protein n=1 Tax=Streptomyces sp. NPDC007148 TaxID=3364775 RepID=UPI0036CB5509
MSPTLPNASREQIVAAIRTGKSSSAVSRELRVDRARVRRIRNELGLLPYVPVEQTRSLEEKWALFARLVDDGHMEWTGERGSANDTPLLRYKEKYYSAAAVAFRIEHGRDPEGYAIADCSRRHCIAPSHVQDEPGRMARREERRRLAGYGERPDRCPQGHDQSVHGRLEADGRAYCAQCKRDLKQAGPKMPAARAAAREAIRRDITELLHAGLPETHIAAQLHVSNKRVAAVRISLGLPAPSRGRRPRYATVEDAFRAHIESVEGNHVRWTGQHSGDGAPALKYCARTVSPYRIAFRMRYGREPVGRAAPGCDMPKCVAGDHLEDQPMRARNKKTYAVIFGGAL